jgi:hypothetical protein
VAGCQNFCSWLGLAPKNDISGGKVLKSRTMKNRNRAIVLYPCLYDPTQRRIITVDAQGQQQYHHFPMVQLALFTFELLYVVWKMLPYRRSLWSRPLLQAQQGNLFEHFAR